MTGTERAALRLALGTLRDAVLRYGAGWGGVGPSAANIAASEDGVAEDEAHRAMSRVYALHSAPPFLHQAYRCGSLPPFPSARILRARLALYIRAVLRSEDGDTGAPVCPTCGMCRMMLTAERDGRPVAYMCWKDRRSVHAADDCRPAFRPLWRDAPEHR